MRLGDDIDDYCSRCKRTTDHSVVSMMGEEVLKVRCRTCNNEHKYRHNQGRKKEMTAKEAFDKVVASITGAPPEEPGIEPEKEFKKGRKKK
jgi:ribosomal protein L44E